MKHKIIILLLVFTVAIAGCKTKTDIIENNKYEGDTAKNISMVIKENTLTEVSATVIIKDNSGNKNGYSKYCEIYKRENDEWIKLNFIHDSVSITTENYIVDEDNTLELVQNWEGLYGKLIPGEYKLVKYATNLFDNSKVSISTNFVIK